MTNDILYLGSQSKSRQKLLNDVCIPFEVVAHTSDEQVVRGDMPLEQYVMAIAQEKMCTLNLLCAPRREKDYRFVLTADTLVYLITSGTILGKPRDREDAKNMMRKLRSEVTTVLTGCCLQKHIYRDGLWHLEASSTWVGSAEVEFHVDEEAMDGFFEREPVLLAAAGAAIIEGYGQLFFKRINGSHSAVIGLPLFELRQELKNMGFLF